MRRDRRDTDHVKVVISNLHKSGKYGKEISEKSGNYHQNRVQSQG